MSRSKHLLCSSSLEIVGSPAFQQLRSVMLEFPDCCHVLIACRAGALQYFLLGDHAESELNARMTITKSPKWMPFKICCHCHVAVSMMCVKGYTIGVVIIMCSFAC